VDLCLLTKQRIRHAKIQESDPRIGSEQPILTRNRRQGGFRVDGKARLFRDPAQPSLGSLRVARPVLAPPSPCASIPCLVVLFAAAPRAASLIRIDLYFEEGLGVKVRLFAMVCCLAMIGSALQGCASDPARSPAPTAAMDEQLDVSRLPQVNIPGAARAEVKSIAMGAAYSKGWAVTKSKKDRVVMQRPLDGEILAYLGPDTQSAAASGGLLEVTSYFLDGAGGVTVATKADLVNTRSSERGPARIDVTEPYRDALDQSLSSLRTAWSDHRDKVANAAPPAEGWKSAWSDAPPPASAAEPGTPITVDEEPEGASAPTIRSGSLTSLPAYEEEPGPAPATPRRAQTQPDASNSTGGRPAPEARRPVSGVAPVTDGNGPRSSAKPSPKKGAAAASVETTRPTTAAHTTKAVAVKSATNKPPASKASWSASAEKYARQKGCKTTSKGAELIESRRDGEIHKVSCSGRDSVLVKCQNGTCKGLL
jgi:hypothetical protein